MTPYPAHWRHLSWPQSRFKLRTEPSILYLFAVPRAKMPFERSLPRGSRPSEMHKAPIRRRKQITIAAEFCTVVYLVATALVLLGNTHLNGVLDTIYFLKLDTSSLYLPQDSPAMESIIRYITDLNGAKLAHFYQVGLWNYCEGYEDKGITYCSEPTVTHYFNPVEMMISKALPAKYGKPPLL